MVMLVTVFVPFMDEMDDYFCHYNLGGRLTENMVEKLICIMN